MFAWEIRDRLLMDGMPANKVCTGHPIEVTINGICYLVNLQQFCRCHCRLITGSVLQESMIGNPGGARWLNFINIILNIIPIYYAFIHQ